MDEEKITSVPIADILIRYQDIYKAVNDFCFSKEADHLIDTCSDSKRAGFTLGLMTAAMIINRDAPKLLVYNQGLKDFYDLAVNKGSSGILLSKEGENQNGSEE